jgi:LPS export ABC transporter protein LptC
MRLITTRKFIVFATVLATACLAVWGLYDSRFVGSEATVELIPDNVDLSLKNIKYTKTHAGKPLWTLVADSAHSMEDGITRIENVRLVFFDRKAGDIELTADQGKLIPEDRIVTVSSNVMVKNSQGDTFQTDYLKYVQTSNSLQTDRMVTINREHFLVTGKGLEMDVIKRTLVLFSDVTAKFGGMDSH